MFESKINRGKANGYAPLDSGSKVPLSYLPPIQSTIDTGSFVKANQTGSFATTSSLQTIIDVTGSYVKYGQTGSFATTGSNLFRGDQNISGSVTISSSLIVSSTFVNNANLQLSGSDLIIDSGSVYVSGSINVSGSVNVTNTFVNRGIIDALNSNLIIEGGYLILTGSVVPINLTGSNGDKKGMVVFDDNYLYYCIANYTPQTYQIIVNQGSSYDTHVSIPKNQGIPNLSSNGWSITTPGNVTYVLTGVYSDGNNWDCEIDNLNSNYNGGTQTMTLTDLNYVFGNIWKKVSLDGLATTSSYALTASYVPNTVITASSVGSVITFTNSDSSTFDVTISQSGSIDSAIYALTASYWSGSIDSASHALVADYVVNVPTIDTSSFITNAQTGSMSVATASYWSGSIASASYALTASYWSGSISSSSYAATASYWSGSILSASYALSSSRAISASYWSGSIASSSYALTSSYWSGSIATASYAIQASSASYHSGSGLISNAVSASYISALTQAVIITGSLNQSGSHILTGSYGVLSLGAGQSAAMIIVTGSNTIGGANYIDFLKVTNTAPGATNVNTSFRKNLFGTIEMINSTYTNAVLSIDDSGSLNSQGNLSLNGSVGVTMPNRPAFRVYGNGSGIAATTVLSGSNTVVDYNQGNAWNNTNGTFTAPVAGLYQVNIVARTAANNNSGINQVLVRKNSGGTLTTQIMLEWAANTTANHIGGSTISKLAVGDTLQAIVAVGTVSFDGNDNFSIAYIG